MRRAETSITDRSLQHCLHSGVDDEVGRGVGHYDAWKAKPSSETKRFLGA